MSPFLYTSFANGVETHHRIYPIKASELNVLLILICKLTVKNNNERIWKLLLKSVFVPENPVSSSQPNMRMSSEPYPAIASWQNLVSLETSKTQL
jgi:hypothetical protein